MSRSVLSDAAISAVTPAAVAAAGKRNWLAFGSGIGIEIGERHLHVTGLQVRPNGSRVLGVLLIENYAEVPAAEWGAAYAACAKKFGLAHIAATVLIPRRDVIVRQIAMPGVSDADLDSAVGFQLETLHPFKESDVIATWARLRQPSGKSPDVMVGIARRTVIDRFQTLFAEAGIKVAAFSFSAATLYSALRLFGTTAGPEGFLAAIRKEDSLTGDAVEAYGESATRHILSTEFEPVTARARGQALAELRLDPATEILPIARFLPPPVSAPIAFDLSRTALSYTAALAGASPSQALPLNLLPMSERAQTSRLRYLPSIVLASLLMLAVGGLWGESIYEQRLYDKKIQTEIARLEPEARKLAKIEKDIEAVRARTQILDKGRRRTKADIDTLAELTRILAAPAWVASFDLTRTSIVLAGEAPQSAQLLKQIDDSPLFQAAEFLIPPARGASLEVFRIRAQREGVEQ